MIRPALGAGLLACALSSRAQEARIVTPDLPPVQAEESLYPLPIEAHLLWNDQEEEREEHSQ